MAEEADFEKNNPVPKGTKEEIDAQGALALSRTRYTEADVRLGWQEMVGGTYLWGRNAGGSLEEEDDVLLAYVVDRYGPCSYVPRRLTHLYFQAFVFDGRSGAT